MDRAHYRPCIVRRVALHRTVAAGKLMHRGEMRTRAKARHMCKHWIRIGVSVVLTFDFLFLHRSHALPTRFRWGGGEVPLSSCPAGSLSMSVTRCIRNDALLMIWVEQQNRSSVDNGFSKTWKMGNCLSGNETVKRTKDQVSKLSGVQSRLQLPTLI